MNNQILISLADNSTALLPSTFKTFFDTDSENYAFCDEFSEQSDRQCFVQLLSERNCPEDVDEADIVQIPTVEYPVSFGQHEESNRKPDAESGERSAMLDFSAVGAVQLCMTAKAQHVAESGSLARKSIPANVIVARIIEQLQTRCRRSEVNSWQFYLPGLLEGSVYVTVEKQANLTWLVELSTSVECNDEKRLALQHQLAVRLGDVTLKTSLL